MNAALPANLREALANAGLDGKSPLEKDRVCYRGSRDGAPFPGE
ncbi:hypothetical protein [Cupriavidus oxalaticus]|uniref:Uncharacterized protein n=1 Tax=Cupriavidus oxalaticus TaxID=96344 RepID=A0A375GPN3_9BURK|nr:hypothetical protein [Cupriavidus oxalaticus]WQD84937.1 hypothetical protein U0036_25135 [Cupriavidus oxalaticus]SPC08273.1 hypothetical protein CO2235_U840014 [Cupriavidus oxalaticus]SPC24300.1 hypothetical protein CO2235_MP80180 [Cupriavidus oxalaticus]